MKTVYLVTVKKEQLDCISIADIVKNRDVDFNHPAVMANYWPFAGKETHCCLML